MGLDRDEVSINWMGFSALTWNTIHPQVQESLHDFIKTNKRDVLSFWDAYPGLLVIWSKIIPWLKWWGSVSNMALTQSRVKINKVMSKFVQLNDGLVVRHHLLEKRGSCIGSVHLPDVGLDGFNFRLAEVLECGLRV